MGKNNYREPAWERIACVHVLSNGLQPEGCEMEAQIHYAEPGEVHDHADPVYYQDGAALRVLREFHDVFPEKQLVPIRGLKEFEFIPQGAKDYELYRAVAEIQSHIAALNESESDVDFSTGTENDSNRSDPASAWGNEIFLPDRDTGGDYGMDSFNPAAFR